MDETKLKDRVLRYLKQHNTMTVATVQDGLPWAAAVFYASEGFTLYYLSDPESRHSRQIVANPSVSVTIHEDYHDWRKIKGIQMEGKAKLLATEEETAEAIAAYARKYPFTAAYLKLLSSSPKVAVYLDKLLRKMPLAPRLPETASFRFYRVTPTLVRFIDNEKGFAQHEEFIVHSSPLRGED